MTQRAFEEMVRQYGASGLHHLLPDGAGQRAGGGSGAGDLPLGMGFTGRTASPERKKHGWCRIAVNKAKDHLKSAYHRRVSAEDFLEQCCAEREDQRPSPAARAEMRETLCTVSEKISRMRAPYREVSALYYLRDCSVAQVARMTGRPSKTVSTQIYRAREMLPKGTQGADRLRTGCPFAGRAVIIGSGARRQSKKPERKKPMGNVF